MGENKRKGCDKMQEDKIALFEEKEIRRRWYKNDWYYSIEDVVKYLTNSNANQYIQKIKVKDKELNNNWNEICTHLEMITKDGKVRKMRGTNTKGILRIVQSITTPKAEEIKKWLVEIGDEKLKQANKNKTLSEEQILTIIKKIKDINNKETKN